MFTLSQLLSTGLFFAFIFYTYVPLPMLFPAYTLNALKLTIKQVKMKLKANIFKN